MLSGRARGTRSISARSGTGTVTRRRVTPRRDRWPSASQATFAVVTPEGLTDSWLSSVLNSDVRVRDSHRIGDGLVGMNIRLELDSDGSVPASLIAKLPSPDPASRATGIALRNYEREVCFYLEIAPTVDIRVARCHHAEWHADTGEFVVLMEDLAPAVQGNQITGCHPDQARTAVLELAKLHGPRWGDAGLDGLEWLSRRGASAGA